MASSLTANITQGSLSMAYTTPNITMRGPDASITMVADFTAGGGTPVHGDSLLIESGSYFLIESGDTLLLG